MPPPLQLDGSNRPLDELSRLFNLGLLQDSEDFRIERLANGQMQVFLQAKPVEGNVMEGDASVAPEDFAEAVGSIPLDMTIDWAEFTVSSAGTLRSLDLMWGNEDVGANRISFTEEATQPSPPTFNGLSFLPVTEVTRRYHCHQDVSAGDYLLLNGTNQITDETTGDVHFKIHYLPR